MIAFVQPAQGVAGEQLTEALKAACERELARYKMPSEWIVVSDFPRNAMGKINKAQLKKNVA